MCLLEFVVVSFLGDCCLGAALALGGGVGHRWVLTFGGLFSRCKLVFILIAVLLSALSMLFRANRLHASDRVSHAYFAPM